MSTGGQSHTPEDLQKVLEISRAMVAAADLDSLLNLIIDRSVELLDAERASLFLYDPAADELYTRIATGLDDLRVPADRGISGATVRTGQTINVPDVYADPRFNRDVDRRTGFRTRNLLSVPLRDFEGGLVGVLQVINKRAGAFDAYDVTLAETLGAQAGVAIQRATLIDHYLQKLEMERAMKIAREIQQGLLPHAAPRVRGFDVAGATDPADETGGDTYDFMPLPDGRWMLMVADATGHGIGPALVVAEARAMFRAVVLQSPDLPRVLRTVNDLLAADLSDARFVTCFFGLLDPTTARLAYASAGHGPMIFYDRRRDAFTQVVATALPLGVTDGGDFDKIITHQFQPGDLAAIPTDGFFEAADGSGEQFGVQRVMELLRRHRDRPSSEIIADLKAAVAAFVGDRPQADDLTAVIVRKT